MVFNIDDHVPVTRVIQLVRVDNCIQLSYRLLLTPTFVPNLLSSVQAADHQYGNDDQQ